MEQQAMSRSVLNFVTDHLHASLSHLKPLTETPRSRLIKHDKTIPHPKADLTINYQLDDPLLFAGSNSRWKQIAPF